MLDLVHDLGNHMLMHTQSAHHGYLVIRQINLKVLKCFIFTFIHHKYLVLCCFLDCTLKMMTCAGDPQNKFFCLLCCRSAGFRVKCQKLNSVFTHIILLHYIMQEAIYCIYFVPQIHLQGLVLKEV
jgi:hypothetical protein